MAIQWPLVLFTLFVCLTCGIVGTMGILALKGRGRDLQWTALVTAAVSLVVGGIAVFTHLQHWERIFNGFGHITSGITQELIGCVCLGIIFVCWFFVLRRGADAAVPKGLAWASIVVALGMVIATGHSYYMPARPAWGPAYMLFYLGSACLMGPVALWIIAAVRGNDEAEKASVQLTFVGGIVQVVTQLVYTAAVAASGVAQFGHYADPTRMTTHPTHVDSLLAVMTTGDGAAMFWASLIAAIVAVAVAAVSRGKSGAKTMAIVAAVAAVAASVMFRVLFYQLGYSVVLLY